MLNSKSFLKDTDKRVMNMKNKKWDVNETKKLFQLVSVFGTDFNSI